MDSMLSLLMLVFLAYAGFGSLNTCRLIRKEQSFFPNKFLLPGNCKAEDCLDEAGYLFYYFPRLLIFALLCIAFLVMLALLTFLPWSIPLWLDACLTFLPLAAFLFLMVVQNRAAKRFW